MFQDIVIILVMSVPMLMFAVYPGLKLGDYFEEKHNLKEKQKRIVIIATTVVFAVTLSSLLHFL
jgi:thiamine transporter ThiT